MRAGVVGRLGLAMESAATSLCREGGARVATSVTVRDMDLPVLDAFDTRRLEIAADDVHLFDSTLVSSHPL